MHLYKVSSWQGGSGVWYCNDVEDLASFASKWFAVPRLLEMDFVDYIKMMKNDFNATIGKYNRETEFLMISFKKQQDCNKYVNWINAKSKKEGWFV